MNTATTNLSIRVDKNVKTQAEAVLNELGINITSAINIFLRQVIRERQIPFMISLNKPNQETISAMIEAMKIAKDPSVKHYSDVEDALKELKR